MKVCDFNNSYIGWVSAPNPDDRRVPGHMPWGNTVRIGIEARCELTNEQTGEVAEYVLIKPCRTEWMYRDDTLLQEPSKEFRFVWSRAEGISVGHGLTYDGDGSPSNIATSAAAPVDLDDRYVDHSMTIRHHAEFQELEDVDEIIQATLDHLPLIARTEVQDADAQMRALIEYPIETMNIHPERGRFQVDAGPVLFPDFARPAGTMIEKFAVAFICYNTFDRADFVLRQPTPVVVDGNNVCHMAHYSDFRRGVEVKNTLFSAGKT